MTSKNRFLTFVFNDPLANLPSLAFIAWPLAVEEAFGVMSGFFLDPWTRRHFLKILRARNPDFDFGVGSCSNTPSSTSGVGGHL
jgi:hypothetical protein